MFEAVGETPANKALNSLTLDGAIGLPDGEAWRETN
jgi:hypothetical protein